jgi:hypothetical protein
MTALTLEKLRNPLYKIYAALAFDELTLVVESKYSKRKRRPALSWRALAFFLLLMYLFEVVI